MDEKTCYSFINELLPGLDAFRRLSESRTVRIQVGPPSSPLPAGADHARQGQDVEHKLHIICRPMKESERPTGPLHGRGYFEHPPPAIHVLYDSPGLVGPRSGAAGAGAQEGQRQAIRQLLTHELSHAVDALVHGMDLAACGPLACSEIRAASAAECSSTWPPFLARRCVRQLAGDSTELVFPTGHGRACVGAVYDACMGTGPGDNPVGPGTLLHRMMREEEASLRAASKQGTGSGSGGSRGNGSGGSGGAQDGVGPPSAGPKVQAHAPGGPFIDAGTSSWLHPPATKP